MTDLKSWMRRHAGRPALCATLGVLAMQAGYLAFVARGEYAARLGQVQRVVETASLGMQQDDRTLIEAALMHALDDAGASAVALCQGRAAEIRYPPTAGPLCARTAGGFLRWVVRRPAVGLRGQEFVFVFERARVFQPFLVLGSITGLLGVVLGVILVRARERFEAEVLRPLNEGLHGSGPLAVRELEALRRRNERYHALRRERAVAKALLELCEQVAHDIRAPVEALTYAVEHPERLAGNGRDTVRAAAARIRRVADALLDGGRPEADAVPAPAVESLSDLVAGVVAEKRSRWKGHAGVTLDFHREAVAGEAFALVDASHFERLVSNVLDNAFEAIGKVGNITVRLARADGRVELSIADTGR